MYMDSAMKVMVEAGVRGEKMGMTECNLSFSPWSLYWSWSFMNSAVECSVTRYFEERGSERDERLLVTLVRGVKR